MMKKWLAAVLVLFSTLALAQSEEKIGPAQKRDLNTFFSNFSEANVQSFKRNSLTEEALLNFALAHSYINNFKSLKKSGDGQSVIVSTGLVDKTTIKYFGLKINRHLKEAYTVPLADGEAYTFSQISRLVNTGDGLFQAEGIIYSTGSGGTPNPHGTPEEWKKKGEDVVREKAFTAVIKAESGRYILLEYIVR